MRTGFGTYQERGATTVGDRRSYSWVATGDGQYAMEMLLSAKLSRIVCRIGADVSRRRKQKGFRFVVSRIEID